jgi:hypothetical protein
VAIDEMGKNMYLQAVRLADTGRLIVRITPMPTVSHPPSTERAVYIDYTEDAVVFFQEAKTNATLFIGLWLSFILPILFGLLGATAFVVRHVLQQIREGSFIPTSSRPRDLVRLMLGALMGVVVGLFADLSIKLSLPPLAIAFLAGYGVESLFPVR